MTYKEIAEELIYADNKINLAKLANLKGNTESILEEIDAVIDILTILDAQIRADLRGDK